MPASEDSSLTTPWSQKTPTALSRLGTYLSSFDPGILFATPPRTPWDEELRELADCTHYYLSSISVGTIPAFTRNPYRANTCNTRTADELFNLRLGFNAATRPEYDAEEDIDSYIRCRNREEGAGADTEVFVRSNLAELEMVSGAGTRVEDSIPERMRHLSQHISTLTSQQSTGSSSTSERTGDHKSREDQSSLAVGLVSVGLAGLGLYLWWEKAGILGSAEN